VLRERTVSRKTSPEYLLDDVPGQLVRRCDQHRVDHALKIRSLMVRQQIRFCIASDGARLA
jgi:hypothetical protein